MAYFTRTGPATYLASEHTGGAWDTATQHIAPALGLLVHAVEADRDARRDDRLVIGRLSYDILGTVPVAQVQIAVEVVRPGRTIELVEARLAHAGRDVVVLRAWLMDRRDTAALAGTSYDALAAPDDLPPWEATRMWRGGFIASADVRRDDRGPGRAVTWVRTKEPLLAHAEVSDVARLTGLLDIANGMAVRVSPDEVAFPNLDLTAHFFREPVGEWLGLDTTVSFGPGGVGLTHSVLHDGTDAFGVSSQVLTVRP